MSHAILVIFENLIKYIYFLPIYIHNYIWTHTHTHIYFFFFGELEISLDKTAKPRVH